ncbi:MAG: flagellar protein FliT [Eubacterium sp.]|nr:flagellar protein FliT [Eubacterium sp.]
MEADYITIMIESLEKKTDVLGHIIELNRQQKLMLQDPNLLPEDFEKNMDYKSQLVDQLNLLDNGFEKLFQRVKETLQENKQQYAVQIEKMQTLIKTITEQTNTIQTQEIRNREEASRKFADVRDQVKGVRNSQKVVHQYYQNMMRQKAYAAQVIDNKK